MLDWAFEALFSTLYGSLVMLVALAAAIPYGAWQGIKKLFRRRDHGGNARTGG